MPAAAAPSFAWASGGCTVRMIERVARALAVQNVEPRPWEACIEDARVAIAAMREPTPYMVACAAVAAIPAADPEDRRLALQAARIAVELADIPGGMPVEGVADAIATMWPAMRALVDAALADLPDQQGNCIPSDLGTRGKPHM